MIEKADTTAFYVWLVLAFLTLAAYAAGRFGFGGIPVAAVLLLSVCLKGQLLIGHFMGLAQVRSPWKWMVTGWLVSVASLIGVAYWVSIAGGGSV